MIDKNPSLTNRYFKDCTSNFLKESEILLNEGLITSYEVTYVMDRIYRKYPKIIQVPQQYNAVFIEYDKNVSDDPDFLHLMNTTGYCITKTISKKINNVLLYEITIEPKFPSKVQIPLPDYLYHISPIVYDTKIETIGLTTKDSKTSFNHAGNRIYLLVSNNPLIDSSLLAKLLRNDLQISSRFLSLSSNPKVDQDRKSLDYNLYEIYNDNKRSYYYDPSLILGDISNTCYAIFTLLNIPKQYISKVQVV